MTHSRRSGIPAAAALALALLVLAGAADGSQAGRSAAGEGARPPCCFTNPQYAGVCVVQPAEGETCSTILAYLNNPRSQGKSYCGNTSIRGGWKRVRCAEQATRGAGFGRRYLSSVRSGRSGSASRQ